jgi:ribosomal protein S18 acetylase RimI-like enzyme
MTQTLPSPPLSRAVTVAVRRAREEDLDALALTFSHAFHDDPLTNWLLPSGRRHQAASRRYFRLLLGHLSHDLELTYTTPELDGAAVWLPPGKQQISPRRQAELVPRFALALGPLRIPRGLRLIAHMDALHARFAPEPHYTLSVLGVVPERQGRGLGAALIEPMLARSDNERLRVYVDTAKPDKVAFYERQGFVLGAETKHPEFPTLWSMTREPR